MADKTQLIRLADDIRSAIHSLDENDKNGWIRVQGSLEALRRATEPPQVFIMKQRFHVCASAPLKLIQPTREMLTIRYADCSECLYYYGHRDGPSQPALHEPRPLARRRRALSVYWL